VASLNRPLIVDNFIGFGKDLGNKEGQVNLRPLEQRSNRRRQATKLPRQREWSFSCFCSFRKCGICEGKGRLAAPV